MKNLSLKGIILMFRRRWSILKYGKKVQIKVRRAMQETKEVKLKNGKSGKKVTNPKQAIAIGLSDARKRGAKVPRKR